MATPGSSNLMTLVSPPLFGLSSSRMAWSCLFDGVACGFVGGELGVSCSDLSNISGKEEEPTGVPAVNSWAVGWGSQDSLFGARVCSGAGWVGGKMSAMCLGMAEECCCCWLPLGGGRRGVEEGTSIVN